MNIAISISITVLLIVGSSVVIWLLWINQGSDKIVELLLPTVGAFILALYFGYKEIWVGRPLDIVRSSSSTAFFEYEVGSPLAMMNLFDGSPSELRKVQTYIEFVSLWRRRFTSERQPDFLDKLKRQGKSIDAEFFDFLECYILETLTERFKFGWKRDTSAMSYVVYGGEGGSTSFGVPDEFSERVSLKKLIPSGNRLIDGLSPGRLEIAVPRDTEVTINRNPGELNIAFLNPRFRFGISVSSVPSLHPTDNTSLDMSFLKRLEAKLRPFNPDKNFENFRIRFVHLSTSFHLDSLRRFSQQSAYDQAFAENLSGFIKESFAWDIIGPTIESSVGK